MQMLSGAVEVYANHGLLVVGSTSWPELDWGDGPADADGRHVVVKTRGQAGHTRVSFWSGSMPLLGTLVFDGDLALEDYRIFVGDLERLVRWTQRISRTGPQRVIIRVDDPGYASRVDVGLDITVEAQVMPLPGTGPVLFDVLTSDRDGIHPANQRGLALGGHDAPLALRHRCHRPDDGTRRRPARASDLNPAPTVRMPFDSFKAARDRPRMPWGRDDPRRLSQTETTV
ncbi:hypothetical protein ACPPVO_33695 [Dactylosporangium sp. McL0621]|uniref:hypothetical protein n=1 Tax=Dactylosporangium sp. McL0621 TaxID=3415678 RepID=UPI003CF62C61